MGNLIYVMAYLGALFISTIIIFIKKDCGKSRVCDEAYDRFRIDTNFPEIEQTLAYAKRYNVESVYDVDW